MQIAVKARLFGARLQDMAQIIFYFVIIIETHYRAHATIILSSLSLSLSLNQCQMKKTEQLL